MRLEDLSGVRPESVSRDALRVIAQRLAAIHASLRRYPDRERVRPTEPWDIGQSSFEELLRSPNPRYFDSHELERLQDIDRRMEAACGQARLPDALTWSVLHGDPGLDHVGILCGDHPQAGEPYFFDFGDFAYGPVALDLAIMLVHLFGRSGISVARWEQLRRWILDGYCSVTRLTHGDLRAIDACLLPWALTSIRYRTRMAARTGSAGGVGQIRRRYQLAAHLLSEGTGPCCPV